MSIFLKDSSHSLQVLLQLRKRTINMKTVIFIISTLIVVSSIAVFSMFKNKALTTLNPSFKCADSTCWFPQRENTNTQSIKPLVSGERRVAVIGDSLSAPGTYVSDLGKKNGFIIETYGSPAGQTGWYEGSSEGNARGFNYKFDTFILKPGKKYDDVIVFGGFNDINTGIPLKTIEDNLQVLYKKINDSKMRVIAISVLPYRGCNCSADQGDTAVQTLNEWIRIKAESVTMFVNAYPYFFDPNDSTSLNKAYYELDGVHLSKEGYKKLAELIYESVYNQTSSSPSTHL